jgi:enolase-phosphatase E1
MIRYVLTDIEGTTTSISFVHDVLFPYSAERMEDFIDTFKDDDKVKNALTKVRQTLITEEKITKPSHKEVIEALLHWIKIDRKHPGLKDIQGFIWEEGYKCKEIKGHLFTDVLPVMNQWVKRGLQIGIYSSGSIHAQKLLFSNTAYGDLTHIFSHYFDTSVGMKRESNSYENIRKQIALLPYDILFLSDVGEELDAAKKAGFRTCQIVRENAKPSENHPKVSNFAMIDDIIDFTL